jgi:hypothetical protein
LFEGTPRAVPDSSPRASAGLPLRLPQMRQNRNPHFDVVDMYDPYFALFGRGFMNKFDPVIRQQFLCMKITTPKGVITVLGDQQEA